MPLIPRASARPPAALALILASALGLALGSSAGLAAGAPAPTQPMR